MSDSKMGAKKKKRLDKYIEKKLKKEERLVIFEKLSKSQAQISTSLNLQSSSSLGTGKAFTNRERLERLEDKQVRKTLEGRAGKRKRKGESYTVLDHAGTESEGTDDESRQGGAVDGPQKDVPQKGQNRVVTDTVTMPDITHPTISTDTTVGSALKRNPDGSVVGPMVKKRTGTKKNAFRSWKHGRNQSHKPDEGDSDTSFDSSDSAYDSESEAGRNDSQGEESDSSDEGPDEESGQPESDHAPSTRKLGFKDWAIKQIHNAKGYAVSQEFPVDPDQTLPKPPPKKRPKITGTSEMRGPLGEDIQLPSTSLAQHLQNSSHHTQDSKQGRTKAITVTRPSDVEEARLLLPITAEEQPIMEAILLHPVVIICGETGSGKTTQVPQFLYEAGFGSTDGDNPGMIGITQPRRVAAISMANRVAHELSLTSSRVSYQIRYDATVSSSTCIKFMTDGVLLRELATDFLLTKYSVIIIDEAHERSMNTDILIGVLSRVLKLREEMWKEGQDNIKPLRLIIMSATLRVSDFAENKALFPSPPPAITVSARQHPVTVHFSRRTSSDYVIEAVKKASKIHSRLPPGGILIFLTGQNEITGVCRKLEAKYGKRALETKKKTRQAAQQQPRGREEDDKDTVESQIVVPIHVDIEAEDMELGNHQDVDLALDVDGDLAEDDPEALESDDEHAIDEELGIDVDETETPMHIVPLYSLLPSEKQMRVFETPPSGSRLVVVSTNVAETSLTIPGIRYVVDSGRAKERRYDVSNGIQAFQVNWISKASAAQRAGRAGRTGPGHCYRLYSSALYEHYFERFSQPEILRVPIEGVVLQMKSMHIDTVINFPFPTPPEQKALRKAETVLTHLSALSALPPHTGNTSLSNTLGGQITELGKYMSLFPLSPRFSRMLVSGRQQGCLPYVISIVSSLSVGDPFLREEGLGAEEENGSDDERLENLTSEAVKAKEARKIRRRAFFKSQQMHASLGKCTSDLFRMLSVTGAYEYAGGGHRFCVEHFVRPKAMEEIHKLRAQISNIVHTNFPDADPKFIPKLRPPNDLQLKILRQLLTAGFIDQVAVRKDLVLKDTSAGNQYANSRGVPYRAMGVVEDVFIHPSSVVANAAPPDYIIFVEIIRTTKLWLKGVTTINPVWLSSLGKSTLCTFSKPTKNSAGIMMTIPKFGPDEWELPPIKADNT